jgi:hypothetical protein
MQDKQTKAKSPQQVEDTEDVDLGFVGKNPIKEVKRRLETKLSAIEISEPSAGEHIPALRKHLRKYKQNDSLYDLN